MRRVAWIGAFLFVPLAGGLGLQAVRAGVEEFRNNVQIETLTATLNPDGTVFRWGGTSLGNVGGSSETSMEIKGTIPLVSSGVSSDPEGAFEPLTEGRLSLRESSRFVPGKGIVIHLEWFNGERLARVEDVVLEDFGSVTRILLVYPESGRKQVVRFTPVWMPPEKPSLVGEEISLRFGPLLRDEELVVGPSGAARGSKVFASVPKVGFFQFSFRPFPGAEASATLDDHVLSFTWQDESYRWYTPGGFDGGPWAVYLLATERVPAEMAEDFTGFDLENVVVGAR